MVKKKSEMLTAYGTWLKLQAETEFNTFFDGLKEYLRSKLQLIHIEGLYSYYSCGAEYHHPSIPTWKPFENFENYCLGNGYDDMAVKELIEEKLGRKIICECELINDVVANKRARLQRSFGIDFGEPGYRDM